MAKSTDLKDIAAGVAALSICEALLLALTDLKIMRVKDVRDALEDATALHHDAPDDANLHREVIAVIERIKSGMKAMPES